MPQTLAYPGYALKRNNPQNDTATVRLLQTRLKELGCGPAKVDGDFGPATEAAVRQFQMRFTDQNGRPLKVDGQVGSITWASLFGLTSVSQTVTAETSLLKQLIKVAVSQIGRKEQPLGSNRGPEVDDYIKCAGLNPQSGSYAWCMCFVYWCFAEAAVKTGKNNPCIKTAGVRDHWNKAKQNGVLVIPSAKAIQDPSLVKPGQLFCMGYTGTTGHIGIVEKVEGGILTTIEGNTNDGGSREGIGVFRRKGRTISSINLGFIDYKS